VLFYSRTVKSAVLPGKRLWERTSVQCLLRNQQSGRYYPRVTSHGKQKWFSLDTDVFSVAKLSLGDKQRGTVAHVAAGKAIISSGSSLL
jgi:hypothetical protein